MWGLYTCKIVSHFIHITYNISSSSTPQVPAHIIPPPFNTTLIQKSSRLLVLTHICGGEIASLTLIFCCQNVGWRVELPPAARGSPLARAQTARLPPVPLPLFECNAPPPDSYSLPFSFRVKVFMGKSCLGWEFPIQSRGRRHLICRLPKSLVFEKGQMCND